MNLIRVYLTDKYSIGFEVSPWVWVVLALLILTFVLWRRHDKPIQVVEVNIQLGGIGHVRLTPTWEDVQIAHQIWTELVTRKAAVPIDPDNDVIVEVYDSWNALFQRIRQLVSDVPGRCIRRDKSTQTLVKIATDTLNVGLRPHLTKWQARFRNWWRNTEDALRMATPQEHQKEFPEYETLLAEVQAVNGMMIQYASELQKIVKGKAS
jgi:hypothetical protein